jgi:hypothetical protein
MLERGVGSQFGRGDKHCGTLGIYVLCDMEQAYLKKTVQPFLSSVLAVYTCAGIHLPHREKKERGKKRKHAVILAVLSDRWRSGGGMRK